MNAFSHRLVNGVYGLIVLCCAGFLASQALRHSAWNQQRLYRQLLTGDATQQLHAASALACVGAQELLLAGLKADGANARAMAQRGLEYIWFHAAGDDAYSLLEAAYTAAHDQRLEQALALLGQLTQRFPNFAEGWNRRAAIYWELGDYAKSQADCARALELNPHHYGAWQGIGLCQLQQGDVAAACRSLRAALQILPHDEATRLSLNRCEALLRSSSSEKFPGFSRDLI